jgi:hypothetical protein
MATYNTFSEMTVSAHGQSVTGTAETNLVTTGNAPGTNLVIPFPQGQKAVWDGKSFIIRACGFVTTDTAATANLKMYYSATSAGAKTTQIGATGASNSQTGSINFSWFAECVWDSTSQILNGVQYGIIGTTVITPVVLTNTVTSLADITGGVWFQPTITFSAVTAAATVKLVDFSLDVN